MLSNDCLASPANHAGTDGQALYLRTDLHTRPMCTRGKFALLTYKATAEEWIGGGGGFLRETCVDGTEEGGTERKNRFSLYEMGADSLLSLSLQAPISSHIPWLGWDLQQQRVSVRLHMYEEKGHSKYKCI